MRFPYPRPKAEQGFCQPGYPMMTQSRRRLQQSCLGHLHFSEHSEEKQYQGGPEVYPGASGGDRLICDWANSQEGVSMATGHGSHRVRVCLIQLHWPRESGILIPPSQSTSGPFAPGVHFTLCPNSYGEGIPTGYHCHLDALKALDLTGCPIASASIGAQLPVLIAAKSVAIT